jgi:Asp-tRNA(Asn)/Glu-tRNA(Gln) amidotransferase A subunit family amidase
MMEGREQQVHWTGLELVNKALEEPAPTMEQVVENLGARDAMRAALRRQLREYPVLLLPACGVTAFPHRMRCWTAGERSIGLFEAMAPLTFSNLLGLPAMVIPFEVTASGVPAGVQLVAGPYGEELLLETAVRLEEARGKFPLPGSL